MIACNVGMCHEMPIGVARLARLLRIAPGCSIRVRSDRCASWKTAFCF
jgi:hypothetical protein